MTPEGHLAVTGHILSKWCFRCSMHNKGGHIFQINLFVSSDFLISIHIISYQFELLQIAKFEAIRPKIDGDPCSNLSTMCENSRLSARLLLRLGNYAKYTQMLLYGR